MRHGNVVSNKMDVRAGIAQGMVLGPLIFIFYINDCVKSLNDAYITMFADDCVLYLTGNKWNIVHEILQRDLNLFVAWLQKNCLSLNGKKSQAMIVGSRNKLSKLNVIIPFKINDINMKYVKQYNYLGVVLDAEMSLVPLCKNVEKIVVDKVYMIRKLRKHLTYHASIQIYKQLILPIFYYSVFLLIACNKDKKHDLQIIQNDVLRFCNNNKREDRVHLDEMHSKAKLISLEQRRCKHILSLMYKLSKNEVNRKSGVRRTRQYEKYVFQTDTKIGTKYASSPFYKGTKLWDKMSRDVQILYLCLKPFEKILSKFDRNYCV